MLRILSLFLAAGWLIAPSPLCQAAEIVILGDSWGVGIGPTLTSVAAAEGFAVDNRAVGGRTADQMANNLNQITIDLSANPDAKIVHLSIGGNDFLGQWRASQTNSQKEAIYQGIIDDVLTITGHIQSIRPEIGVFHMGYDFPRPIPPIGTPQEINEAALLIAGRQEALQTDQYIPLNYYGLTQIEYGITNLGIPPHDPSLPRTDQPGAAEAHSDAIHLKQEAYQFFSERVFDEYRVVLVPEPTSAGLVAIAAVAVIGYRRRR